MDVIETSEKVEVKPNFVSISTEISMETGKKKSGNQSSWNWNKSKQTR